MEKLMMIMAAVAVAFGAIAEQCTAKTQDGARCKREAVEGTKYCWQHSKSAKKTTGTDVKKAPKAAEKKAAAKPAAK